MCIRDSDSNAATDERLAATSRLSLGDFSDSVDVLRRLLSPQQPAAIRDAAAEQVSNFSESPAVDLLIESVVSLSPQSRRKALAALASRPKSAARLLGAVAGGVLPETQIPSQLRQNLLRHRDNKVAALAKQTFGDTHDRDAIVREYSRVLDSRGDIDRGANLFQKVCASCHRLGNHGSHVGPDLEPLRNRGAQFMLSNILDPNREIDARYEGYIVATNDGRSLSGIMKDDSTNSVTLLQADGKEVTIQKSQIDEFASTGRSLMPDGLERELTEQGLADVIAFLVQPE